MGTGFGGLPFNPRSPLDLVKWIYDNVDCYPGIMPTKVTESVYDKLIGLGASTGAITTAMSAAKVFGYDFADAHIWIHDHSIVAPIGNAPVGNKFDGPHMSKAPPLTKSQIADMARTIEQRFKEAELNHNDERMKELGEAWQELVLAYKDIEDYKDLIIENTPEVGQYNGGMVEIGEKDAE
jgi:hypothetical protein